MKRILSLTLTVAMVFALLPTFGGPIFADDISSPMYVESELTQFTPADIKTINLKFSEELFLASGLTELKSRLQITRTFNSSEVPLLSVDIGMEPDNKDTIIVKLGITGTLPEGEEFTLTIQADSITGITTNANNLEIVIPFKIETIDPNPTADTFYHINIPNPVLWNLRGSLVGGLSFNNKNVLFRISDDLYAISFIKDAGFYDFKLTVGDSWSSQFGAGSNTNNYDNIHLTLNKRSKVTIYFKDNDIPNSRKLYVNVVGVNGMENAATASITSDNKIKWYSSNEARSNIVLTAGTMKTYLEENGMGDDVKFVDYNLDGDYYTLIRSLPAGTYTATAGSYGNVTFDVSKPLTVKLYIDFNEATPTLKYEFVLKEPKISLGAVTDYIKPGQSKQLTGLFRDEIGDVSNQSITWSLATPVAGVSLNSDGLLTVAPTVSAEQQFTVVATVNYTGSVDPTYNRQYTASKTITVKNKITELKINYLRYEEDYDDWNLWAWVEGETGSSYPLTEIDNGMLTGTVSILKDVNAIYFILRKGDWADKDGGNRRVDINNGNEIWLLQDDEAVYYTKEEAVSPKLAFAVMDSNTQVKFKVNSNPNSINFSRFAVYQNGVKLSGMSVGDGGSGEGIVTLTSTIDPTALLEIRDASGVYPPQKIILRNVLNNYYYAGNDLGYTKSGNTSNFKVWAPTAKKISTAIYNTAGTYNSDGFVGDHSKPDATIAMTRNATTGVWTATSTQDLTGKYYMYKAEFADGTVSYAVDPYARAVSANGQRTAIVDLAATNPTVWTPNLKPQTVTNDTDHIIYELHVRDFSIDANANFENKGKYLAFTETGLTHNGKKIGIDHLKELGITTVQLMPTFDFATINELTDNGYNWGYDPQNFNVPEGSYSTNAQNPAIRITEFKQMVQALHDAGIRVVMDVVYNHTFDIENSSFNKLVPGYYYRTLDNSMNYANGSESGNEIASERAMVRKYILDSVKYWAREYSIDGFRFDLMGLLDETTASMMASQLKSEIDPSIIIYGEPLQAGGSPLQNGVGKGSQKNQDYAVFNDNIRTAIKGDSDNKGKGFATGATGMESEIVKGILGATGDFTSIPAESINYVTSHDNLNLYDKVIVSSELNDTLNMLWNKIRDGKMIDGSSVETAIGNASPYDQINPNDVLENNVVKKANLSTAMLLTMQGVPFFQAGDEFIRTKFGDSNSYKSPDGINAIRWGNKEDFTAVSDYYAGLIQLRKEHPAFRMSENGDLNNIEILRQDGNVVVFKIKNYANGDNWRNIVVIYNASDSSVSYTLPNNDDNTDWNIVVYDKLAGTEKLGTPIGAGSNITVSNNSAMVLYDIERAGYVQEPTTMELARDTVIVEPGKTAAVKITVKDQNGVVMNNPTITGISANPAIATFAGGVVTGVSKGNTVITLSCGNATANLNAKVMGLNVELSLTSASSRQNPVLTVSSTDVTIKSIYANLSQVGGKTSYYINAATGKAAFGIQDYITAGTKTITVTVTDINNNTYVIDKEITVAKAPSTGFDWDEARIYHMITDRFYDGNAANNDTLVDKTNPGAYHGGDFAGVTAKLDYLKNLGINTIWISPIVENVTGDFGTSTNGSYYAYHGYWANDFERLNPYMGTRAELETLIDEAAARGIKLMVDVVLNNAGYGTENNANFDGMFRATGGNDDETASLAGLPDFKTEEQAVRTKLIDWQVAWASLKTAKGNSIAYFRLDTAKHVDHETLRQFKTALATVNAEHKIIGEIWADDVKINSYLNNGEMDSALDFGFNEIVKSFIDGNLDNAESLLEARNASLSNVATKGNFLSSINEDGFFYSMGNDMDMMKIAASLQMTAKGQPIVYYGEELGMSGENNWPIFDNRKDFDWDDTVNNALLQHYTKLLNIRAEYSKLFSKGTRAKVNGGGADKYMVFSRSYENQMALVGLNLKYTEETVQISTGLSKGITIFDKYNNKTYTTDANGTIIISIPPSQEGGTAILIASLPVPPTGNGTGGGTTTPPGTTNQVTISGNTATVMATSTDKVATATISASDFEKILSMQNGSLKIESPIVTITFDSKAKSAIAAAGKGDVKITVSAVATSTLSAQQQAAVLGHPVYNFSIMVGKNTVSSFGDGKAKISIPYTPAAGENPNNIVIYYLSNDGKVQKKPTCQYKNGQITFITNHFSKFAIAHNPITFNDISKHWGEDAINFVAARELFGGIGNDKFDPNGVMTRAMFATVIARLEGANLSEYTKSNFTDVGINEWYGPAVAWAADKGIVSGYGNGKFGPNDKITREQMAVIFTKYLKFIDQGPSGNWMINVPYSDKDQISKWALEGVAFATIKGLSTGKEGNRFDSQGTATRVEVAAVVTRLVKSITE